MLRLKHSNLEQSPSKNNKFQTFRNAYQMQDKIINGDVRNDTSNNKCSNSNNHSEANVIDQENDNEQDHCEAQDIQSIESLLDLETSYLTDSSVHSSDRSSDEHSDVEFDISYEP
jgi:hypothetical protein